MKKVKLFQDVPTKFTFQAWGVALFLFLVHAGSAWSDGIMSIDQLTPIVSSAENDFLWEAHIPGVDLKTCSFSWKAVTPDRMSFIFFRQTTWMGDMRIDSPGEYLLTAKAVCNGNTYTATKSVLVYGNEPQVPEKPQDDSNIPSDRKPRPNAITLNNPVCTYWTEYEYDTHKYYRYRNAACTGGAGKKRFDSQRDEKSDRDEWDSI